MITERHWYSFTTDEVLKALNSSRDGLSEKEAQTRLTHYGANKLREKGRTNPALLLLKQFASPMVYILLIVVIVEAVVLDSLTDAGVILFIVLLNAIIGFVQELRAEHALEALKKMTSPMARVKRNKSEHDIPASQLVPGDIIILEGGDKVPADARLMETAGLSVDESALTGESVPIDKISSTLKGWVVLADMVNMVHMGTSVASGRGIAVVTATGMDTQFGRIVAQVQETKPPLTPLQKNVAKLGRYIAYLVVGIVILIVAIGIGRGYGLAEVFLLGVAAVVSAIPEELIVMVTVALSMGMRRMAGKKALVRKLQAVETMGAVTVICSDKTGTLTEGEMTVREIFVDNRTIEVTGNGYNPQGEFLARGQSIEPLKDGALALALKIAVMANDTNLEHKDGQYQVLGDPTEGALLTVGLKAGLERDQLRKEYPRVSELPFQSESRYLATLHQNRDGSGITYVEGSFEEVLRMSRYTYENGRVQEMTEDKRQQIRKVNEDMASRALRVAALAYYDCEDFTNQVCITDIEGQLIFVALTGMIDPPREEVKSAIAACNRAGIKVVMITGDQKVTARAIALQLGIPAEEVLTGQELAALSRVELVKRIDKVQVFARVEPLQKLKVVEAFKDRGHIAAMTGDGVNDAPALRAADIGVSMGIKGTDVAREASDIVLADDDFTCIVEAVEEGRIIFSNIRRSVFFLLSTSLGELFTWAIVLLAGLPLPVAAVQILWINLVTDGACVTPLGVEPKHGDVMNKPPQNPKSGILYSGMLFRTMFLSIIMAGGTVGLFYWQLQTASLETAQTMAFCTIVGFQWFNALNSRSTHQSVFKIGFFSNRWLMIGLPVGIALQLLVIYVPPLQDLFHTVPLNISQWGIIVGVAASVWVLEEIRKAAVPHLFDRGK
jgi:P-type Ca2+ transporter type 2C